MGGVCMCVFEGMRVCTRTSFGKGISLYLVVKCGQFFGVLCLLVFFTKNSSILALLCH